MICASPSTLNTPAFTCMCRRPGVRKAGVSPIIADMAMARDRAICLRKLDYSETSQILQIFTREHGVLRVIAKGAHRRTKAGASKFDGGLDLLDLGHAVFIHQPEKDLSTLTEWALVDGHLGLRDALRPTYLSQYAAELVGLLFEEHDPHPEVFDRLERLLAALQTPRREEAFLMFQLGLLAVSGFMPELATCVQCYRPAADASSLSPSRGGVVCRNCEDATPDRQTIDPRLIRLLQTLLRHPQRPPQLTRHQTDPINRALADHVEYATSRRLRLVHWVTRPEKRPATKAPPDKPATTSRPPAAIDDPSRAGTLPAPRENGVTAELRQA